MEYSNLSTFKESIKTLENFITDREWLSMLKIDIALNPVLEKELVNLINQIDYNNIKVDDFNDLIMKLRDKFYYYKEIAFKEKDKDIISKWYKYRHAYAYYGFIEVITEGSIINDKLLDRLKAKYGNSYLNILKQIDKENPSLLTGFKKKNFNIELDDDTKLYLTMKK